jgi:phosphatidylserine decarboxylase
MKIAVEAWPFAVPLMALAIAGAFLHPLVAAPFVIACAFVLWFFRDPERIPPDDADTLVCPADGKIIKAGPRMISVFMNVFNVHVVRSPIAGCIESVEHLPGRFMAAWNDRASEENERLSIVVADGPRRVRFVLVAGLVARRIVCKVRPGQPIAAGERVGLIRFGSRVDVELLAGSEVLTCIGDRVVAGETLLARIPRIGGEAGLAAAAREKVSV